MGEADPVRRGRRTLLDGHLRDRVPRARLHTAGPGHRRSAGRQGAGRHPPGAPFDPAALQRHHRPVHLLPGQGPRPAGGGAGRRAASLPREAGRNGGALVLDGRAAGAADLHGLRDRVLRRAAVSLRRPRRVRAVPDHSGGRGDDPDGAAAELLPGAPHARAAGADRPGGAGDGGDPAPVHAARAARAARGLPQLRRLPRRAAHADQPAAAERVDRGYGHELAPAGSRPVARGERRWAP